MRLSQAIRAPIARKQVAEDVQTDLDTISDSEFAHEYDCSKEQARRALGDQDAINRHNKHIKRQIDEDKKSLHIAPVNDAARDHKIKRHQDHIAGLEKQLAIHRSGPMKGYFESKIAHSKRQIDLLQANTPTGYHVNEETIEEATKAKPADKPAQVRKWSHGDIVYPKVGPHKGEPHKVIHVHPDGSMNIVPQVAVHAQNKYRLGVARCTDDQLDIPTPEKKAKALEKRNTPKDEPKEKSNEHVAVRDKEGKFAGRFRSMKDAQKIHKGGGVTFHPIKLNEEHEMLAEEMESHLPDMVNELSRSTLGRYVKVAHDNALENQRDADDEMNNERSFSSKYHKIATNNVQKRTRGIDRATDKLVREDEQINELSTDLLSRYIPKATAHQSGLANARRMEPHGTDKAKRLDRKLTNRTNGVFDALKAAKRNRQKRVTEEEQIDELSKDRLRNYFDKASRARGAAEKAGDERTFKKRDKGTGLAVDKILKEDDHEEHEDAYGRTGEKSDCYMCHGSGKEYDETCVTCGGRGYVRDKAHIHEISSEKARLYMKKAFDDIRHKKSREYKAKSQQRSGFIDLASHKVVKDDQAKVHVNDDRPVPIRPRPKPPVSADSKKEVVRKYLADGLTANQVAHKVAGDGHMSHATAYHHARKLMNEQVTTEGYYEDPHNREQGNIVHVIADRSKLDNFNISHHDRDDYGERKVMKTIKGHRVSIYQSGLDHPRQGGHPIFSVRGIGTKIVPHGELRRIARMIGHKDHPLEESTEINELSHGLLDRYVHRASGDFGMSNMASHSTTGKEHEHWANRVGKRRKGIATAIDKQDGESAEVKRKVPASISEQEVLAELSKNLLGRYATKAAASGRESEGMAARAHQTASARFDDEDQWAHHYDRAVKHENKARRRQKGVLTALSKMNEDEQIDEGVIATAGSKSGNRYELHKNKTYSVIIKTHQNGEHIQNKWGGYNAVRTGSHEYVAKKWKSDYGHLPQNVQEAQQVDEARRGRPPKNAVAGREEDERENIIVQLRKNINMGGAKKVKFADGSSHDVPPRHSETILSKYAGMQPRHKEQFQKHIEASHANLMSGHDWKPTETTSSISSRPLEGKDARTIKKPLSRRPDDVEAMRRNRLDTIRRIAARKNIAGDVLKKKNIKEETKWPKSMPSYKDKADAEGARDFHAKHAEQAAGWARDNPLKSHKQAHIDDSNRSKRLAKHAQWTIDNNQFA